MYVLYVNVANLYGFCDHQALRAVLVWLCGKLGISSKSDIRMLSIGWAVRTISSWNSGAHAYKGRASYR